MDSDLTVEKTEYGSFKVMTMDGTTYTMRDDEVNGIRLSIDHGALTVNPHSSNALTVVPRKDQ